MSTECTAKTLIRLRGREIDLLNLRSTSKKFFV